MAGGAADVFNGERAVVALFVSRVLLSAPLSLLYESLALFLLSACGLLVEISVESSSAPPRFKTRPGASSGTLLGAVTLPAVILSRLIQLSRVLLENNATSDEISGLDMQFWTVSASCFSVLIFFCLTFQHSPKNTTFFQLKNFRTSNCGLMHMVLLSMALCYLSFTAKADSGYLPLLKFVWLICHSLASVMLIQHILQAFPSCASLGEVLLVSSGLMLYFGDALAHSLSKALAFLAPSALTFLKYGTRSEIAIVIQGVMVGLFLFPAFYKIVLWAWLHLTNLRKPEALATNGGPNNVVEMSVLFYASLLFMLTALIPAWMYLVWDFQKHPVAWVFTFVFSDPLKHLALCLYWVCVICVSVLRFYDISKHSKIERILLRKYYHLVAVLMFSPALLLLPAFLNLAFGAAFAVFLVLEMIRVWKIWPLGHTIHQFMNAFTDHRDSDILIVSHFSLLLGCALPIWMSSGLNDRPLAPFAGILSLGIGDTMASVVGHKYGVLRWSKTGKKTIEGTAAGITSVLAACSVLLPLLASTGYFFSQHWLSLLVAVTVSGLLEAYTAQLDNAFIPLVFYSLLCL
ncbi:dolichol kinase EVAN-like isoform X1 [Zingiber officinale]|uniref:dolichol kinase EVAN-like isoform X1 n=2 Tax=Zingiber officinale TaxID=94328 RepID=UPI001C4A9EB8|nr:dolichol kinase EVAN-like isoform X1 [Zingiber officinale]